MKTKIEQGDTIETKEGKAIVDFMPNRIRKIIAKRQYRKAFKLNLKQVSTIKHFGNFQPVKRFNY